MGCPGTDGTCESPDDGKHDDGTESSLKESNSKLAAVKAALEGGKKKLPEYSCVDDEDTTCDGCKNGNCHQCKCVGGTFEDGSFGEFGDLNADGQCEHTWCADENESCADEDDSDYTPPSEDDGRGDPDEDDRSSLQASKSKVAS